MGNQAVNRANDHRQPREDVLDSIRIMKRCTAALTVEGIWDTEERWHVTVQTASPASLWKVSSIGVANAHHTIFASKAVAENESAQTACMMLYRYAYSAINGAVIGPMVPSLPLE